tara:strand:+ start:1529 stop:1702 length:174 start_codon:yes stop_codon:yes gene_type:complete
MHLKMQIGANMDRHSKLIERVTYGRLSDKHMDELGGLDSLIKNQQKRLKEIEAPLLN